MKFVRWLGAFGKQDNIAESATWELSQTERQVAAEPLWHGKSFLNHAKIGLEIAHPEATFSRGWLQDAYTEVGAKGVLIAERCRDNEFKNMDKFLKAFNKLPDKGSHGEASFNCPLYCAVVVKKDASKRGRARALRLALFLNLPLKRL